MTNFVCGKGKAVEVPEGQRTVSPWEERKTGGCLLWSTFFKTPLKATGKEEEKET